MRQRFQDTIRFFSGFILSRPKIDDPSFTDNRTHSADYATRGSSNVMFHGQAKPRPFKGLSQSGLVGLVGGTFYSGGTFSLAPVKPGFDIDDIAWGFTVCAGGNPSIGNFENGETLITNTNASQSQDAFTASPFTVTTDATLRFRFTRNPAIDGATAIVALRYTPIADCDEIEDSVLDRGFECRLSNGTGGPTLKFGSRPPGGAWDTAYTEDFTDTSDIYEIRITSGTVTFRKNGLLKAAAIHTANGSPLGLFIRLDGQGGPTRHAQVGLQFFADFVVV